MKRRLHVKGWFRAGAGLATACMALACLLCLLSRTMRPEVAGSIKQYSPEALAEAEAIRDIDFDPEHPLVLQQDVDYAEGAAATWFPKTESPVLSELVTEGKLPPVPERVGPEPCVQEGVEGIGAYGGTWMRLANSDGDIGIVKARLGAATLLRWSPQGYPLVPHVAKSYTASPDSKEFVFHLRKGMRWSDGHPFTADDILYWWEHEAKDTLIYGTPPGVMLARGELGNIEKVDDHTVRFTFPNPNGLFPALVAMWQGHTITDCPAHYLKQYHPKAGNQELIEQRMNARKLQSPLAVYRDVKNTLNPEHPRLWPWVYRTYKSNPPQTFVRNPYYWMVDTQGNQLPYIDRLLFEVKSPNMIAISVANGEVSMQARHVRYDQYTLLLDQREQYGYDVFHWYPADRSVFIISPNLNRRVDEDKPETRAKHVLLNDKRFRQALSLAIKRRDIIDAEYNGQTQPAQNAPGPASFFYEPSLYNSFVDHDPVRANQLLDEIGLTGRDFEGFRTAPDGTRLTFFINYCSFTGEGAAQFVADDWTDVGIRALLRERSRSLFYTEKAALLHDFSVWGGNSEFVPILEPRFFVPVNGESNYAIGYAKWYARGGLYGDARASRQFGCIEPPPGHPLRRAMEIYEQTMAESTPERQRDVFREVLRISAENVWNISVSTPPPVLCVVKKGFRNVPAKVASSWNFLTPANAGIETYYFDRSDDSEGAVAQTKTAIVEPTLPPDAPATETTAQSPAGNRLAKLLKVAAYAIAFCLVLLTGMRHPFVGKRLLILGPTLLIISVLVFVVIQLPPGDYVTTRIMQLQESGDEADLQQIEELIEMFHLRESVPKRYARWLGLNWFVTRDASDKGLLQGNMGRSMESQRLVNDVVGDRILLTVLISLGTILFTWVVAIPIGIYSAVRQYSIGDYVLTFLGFIGMCVPSFLLALLLMYFSAEFLGISVSGLFSSQFAAQPEWTWGKVMDLLRHIWVPIVVLGVGGTAGMIRVMRANLLDELRKPYVVTARAKGVRPVKLLFKYPVRLALNPFISGIGGIFPQLVSGGAIVAMVLSLPTVGPMMLSALMSEDMYLAGSMLMVLSILGVLGTLVSDLLLLALDPRIRFQGGTR